MAIKVPSRQTAIVPTIDNRLTRQRLIARNSQLLKDFGEDLQRMPALWREFERNRTAIENADRRAI